MGGPAVCRLLLAQTAKSLAARRFPSGPLRRPHFPVIGRVVMTAALAAPQVAA